ncbi:MULTISPECIES: hypothetical protein [unclassified Streptomyces]|uniref:hypothetical protein n=1 Tax=unclassified Streptomyces TaxID=2593676 RepID=UPI0036E89DB1
MSGFRPSAVGGLLAVFGGLILSLADVRTAFLAGGLLTVVACTVLLVRGRMRRLAVR